MNEVLDMSRFIEAKSDQLNADDLIGTSKTITVTNVTGSDGEQPVAIHYAGDNGKPFKPCKTIRRVLVGVWGKFASDYVGRSMTLYRDDRVTFGGLEVGGIRISHMSHMEKETLVVVMKSKGKKVGIKVLPLTATVETAAFTVENARQLLRDASTLDELAATWRSKGMAPFRDQLQAELDARKAELSEPASDHEDRGESLAGRALADQLINETKDIQSKRELGIWEKEMEPRYLTLDDDLRLEVDGEIAAVRGTLA
jgi:hypothetical protein